MRAKMMAGIGGQIYEREDVLEIRPLVCGAGCALAKDTISKAPDERDLPRAGAIGDYTPQAQQFLCKTASERKAGIEREPRADNHKISRIKFFCHVAPFRAVSYHQSRNE